jgi:putative protease
MRKPEIMSPAGHWPQLRAAIEAGADSVYFGLQHFSARAKVGFTLGELPEVMRTLHRRGVKGYVTFNTLVFDHEIRSAVDTLAEIARAGADAVIVQDLGVLSLCRKLAPDLEIHASTQMSVTSVEGVRLAQRLGASRVNLARELSLEEIRQIREATDCELEIFVHGALCVAYSGQCFSSEAWGGRSANRGQCAQACRLSYRMVVDGEAYELIDERYLLSPGDLYALERIPDILPLGIASLKIEGRYKDAEYVALTTAAYRKAVDEAHHRVTAEERARLEQVYSRGLGDYFLAGTDHQRVVRGRAPRHRGLLMGQVERVGEKVVVRLNEMHAVAPLKPGDGVVFDAAAWRSPDEPEEGGRLYGIRALGKGLAELEFANRAIDLSRVRAGDLLWRSDDPEIAKYAKTWTEATAPVYRRPVDVRVQAVVGERLRMEWGGVAVESAAALGAANNQGLTRAVLEEQLSRLGNTPYRLGRLEAKIEGDPFVPVSLLNQLRREAVEKLEARAVAKSFEVHPLEVDLPRVAGGRGEAMLHLLVRSERHLDAAIEERPASITLDYLDLYGLKPSVERVRDAGIAVRVATPRVIKPGEERVVDFLRRLECPLLVRAAGLLDTLDGELTADFSLNVANAWTAKLVLEMGAERLTPGHDLNGAQILELAQTVDPAKLEVIAYQHLPVFHTEHCVFCRFMSSGTSYKDCGRPCEEHELALEDKQGRRHAVIADVGCRNTVFGAEAQEATAFLKSWRDAGIRHYRLEFVHEDGDAVREVARIFREALEGQGGDAGAKLRRLESTTQGSLFVAKGYQELPVLQ